MKELIRRLMLGIMEEGTRIKLGRWSLKYEERELWRVVKNANEDNCGCCEKEKEIEEDYYKIFML